VLQKNNKTTINCKGKLIDISAPIVMGIINTTPDSFYDGGKNNSVEQALAQTKKHIHEGATIIDVGGYSSRPGAAEVSEQEEINRVIPVIEAIIESFPDTTISIDTFRCSVAEKAIEAGAAIINDISAGEIDKNMFDTVAKHNIPYIMMHMQGTPRTMQNNPTYKNIIQEITYYFSEKINALRKKGVNDIIIDPGFGFGKTLEHNYEILGKLNNFQLLNVPILAGISRKSMIHKLLEVSVQESLNGTIAANIIALKNGANVLRVHDVKEAVECVRLDNKPSLQPK
jgi:dihydropteroate synthase|tara:strand:+ start:34 stop:888 length:855 start_codon:yes stop_codon:yes gene_type:complete